MFELGYFAKWIRNICNVLKGGAGGEWKRPVGRSCERLSGKQSQKKWNIVHTVKRRQA